MNLPGNPYPLNELFGTVWRMFGGAKSPEPWAQQAGTHSLDLQPSAPTSGQIGFVGDILPLMWRKGEISSGIQRFFSDCNAVVGNFEGIFTDRTWLPFLQKHTSNTFESLLQAAPAEKWYLNVANNHAGDFGSQQFERTLQEITRQGMQHFGSRQNPTAQPLPGVQVHSWTRWQNRPSPWVCLAPPAVKPSSPSPLSIAYPHWGYEYERRPRASQRETLPQGHALIVGHHSHFAQPVERLSDGTLCAWSLGNFITEVKLTTMGEGMILKVGIGPRGQIVSAHHANIRLDRSDSQVCRVKILGEA